MTAQSLNSSSAEREVRARPGVERVDRGLDPLHAVGGVLEDQLDQEIAGGAGVGLIRRQVTAAVAARLLPDVLEERERGAVVLQSAAPARQRGLAVEHLVVGGVRAAGGVPVEEDREVREALVDPRELARVGVVVQQVLELVRDHALDREVGRVGVADHLVPVLRVDDDHVHAVLVDELRREVADRVLVGVAVVVRAVDDVVGEHDERFAVRVGGVGGFDRAVVLGVDLDDARVGAGADELVAQPRDLVAGDLEVVGRVRRARRELVGRVAVDLRIGPDDAVQVGVVDRVLRRVDVDRRAVRGGAAEVQVEGDLGLPAGDVVADADGDRRVTGGLRRGGRRADRERERQRGPEDREPTQGTCGQEPLP